MNRRVLLIDRDIAFRDTLTHELGRYRVIVMTEADADRALALANADAPALIILAIEEAEKKAGFRVFEKCKKGALSRVPIILVTASVPPESFAKHRGLKVHADEYIDKRTMSTHELVGKIDGLIALGDPDDELSIPVEDEIPMEIADGDVVLDEVVGDDQVNEDFQDPHEMRTVSGDGLTLDRVMEAETDAAFDMLMGDDHPPALDTQRPPTAPPEPEPMPEPEPEPEAAEGVVPELIHDGRGRGTTPPPLHSSVPGIIHDVPPEMDSSQVGAPIVPDDDEAHLDAVPEPVAHPDGFSDDLDEPVEQVEVEEISPHDRYESSPAIPIDDEELVPLEDELPVTHAVSAHESPTVARSVVHEAPTAAVDPIIIDPPRHEQPQRAVSPAPQRGSGSHPAIDLGLEMVAQDAEADQSGVYDRRALRKIGELERQIAQLKAELERTRVAGDAAAKGGGRESQFLNLRESMLAKDKELKQLKSDLVARDQELAEAKERLRQTQHAKTALEGKNTELESRLVDDSGKSTQLATQARQQQAQLTTLQQELDALTRAHANAETSRAQLERDLANERATGAASASEAERLLRVEREQLLARNQGELNAIKQNSETEL
jgi:CheY-like chemotaxis protein